MATTTTYKPDDFANAVHEELHSTFAAQAKAKIVPDDEFAVHYEPSHVVSLAILDELYDNVENGPLSKNALKAKNKSFKAKLKNHPKNPKDLLKTLQTGRALDDDDDEGELVLKAQESVRKAIKLGRFSASPAVKKVGVRRSESQVTPGSTKRPYNWKDPEHKNKKRALERKDTLDEIKSKFMAKLLPLGQDSGEEVAKTVNINKEENTKVEEEDSEDDKNEADDDDNESDTEASKSESESEEEDDNSGEDIETDGLFVGSLNSSPSKVATGRQLAVLVNKSFGDLMKRTRPSNSEEPSNHQVKLREVLDKIKGGKAGELTPSEEVTLREELRL